METFQPLYLGEAEDCVDRIKQQNKSKDWWNAAIVCVSKTADFTKAHVKYLEWFCYEEAVAAGSLQVIPNGSNQLLRFRTGDRRFDGPF